MCGEGRGGGEGPREALTPSWEGGVLLSGCPSKSQIKVWKGEGGGGDRGLHGWRSGSCLVSRRKI